MIPELAEDYSAYLKTDLSKELGPAKDSVEDMLTRLEEFQGLISMVQSEGFQSVNAMGLEVLERKPELIQLCGRIDDLEKLVGRIKHDLDSLETLLDNAETDCGGSGGVFKKVLGPLFSKKTSDASTPKNIQTPDFGAIGIFNSNEIFDASSSSSRSP